MDKLPRDRPAFEHNRSAIVRRCPPLATMPLPSLRFRPHLPLGAVALALLMWAGGSLLGHDSSKGSATGRAQAAPAPSASITDSSNGSVSSDSVRSGADAQGTPWKASGTVGAALPSGPGSVHGAMLADAQMMSATLTSSARTVELPGDLHGETAGLRSADSLTPEDRITAGSDGGTLNALPVHARHMIVMDDRGQVLAAKDADTVVPIASLTKLMTAMVVLDARQSPQEELRIDDEDVDRLKHSASRVRVGARLSRADALEMALMASENRAASALARAYPGGLPAFEAAVQAKIRALGLTHTTLNDPTGLSPANLSTAAEVARIAMAASHYPDIVRITSVKSSTVEVNGRGRELRNTNHLVGAKGWDIRLSKTGFTNEAGRCLAMRIKQGARTLTVVLLDADGSSQRLQDASLIRRTLAGEPAPAERPARKHHKVRLS